MTFCWAKTSHAQVRAHLFYADQFKGPYIVKFHVWVSLNIYPKIVYISCKYLMQNVTWFRLIVAKRDNHWLMMFRWWRDEVAWAKSAETKKPESLNSQDKEEMLYYAEGNELGHRSILADDTVCMLGYITITVIPEQLHITFTEKEIYQQPGPINCKRWTAIYCGGESILVNKTKRQVLLDLTTNDTKTMFYCANI